MQSKSNSINKNKKKWKKKSFEAIDPLGYVLYCLLLFYCVHLQIIHNKEYGSIPVCLEGMRLFETKKKKKIIVVK